MTVSGTTPGNPRWRARFAVYTALLVGTVRAQPKLVAGALAMLVVAYGLSWMVNKPTVEDGRGR